MPEESTTPDLVELARRVREPFNRGEFDLALTFCAPDAVMRRIVDATGRLD